MLDWRVSTSTPLTWSERDPYPPRSSSPTAGASLNDLQLLSFKLKSLRLKENAESSQECKFIIIHMWKSFPRI